MPISIRRLPALLALIALMLCVAATGCTSASNERQLQAAEHLIDTHPDSALTLLLAIDRTRLHGDEHRARHALLLSQAYDKNFVDIASDSLISIAVAYYYFTPDADTRLRLKTAYYKGVVEYYKGNYPQAIYHLTLADSLASRLHDWTFAGLANSLMAFSFKSFSDLRRELEHSKRALDFFLLEGDSIHVRNQLYTVGLAYDQLQQYDSAMIYFNRAGLDFSFWGVASALLGMEQIDRFKEHQKKYPALSADPIIQSRYSSLLIDRKRYEEADSVLGEAKNNLRNQNDSIQWIIPRAYLLRSKTDWKGYANNLESLLGDEISQNHLIKHSYAPISQSMAKEFLSLSDLRLAERKTNQLRFGLTCAFFLILIAVLMAIIWNRTQRNRYNRQLLRLAELNTRMRRDNDGLTRDIHKMTNEKEIWKNRAEELHGKLNQIENYSADYPPSQSDLEYIIESRQNINRLYEQLITIPSSDSQGRYLKIRAAIDYYHQPRFTDRVDNYIDNSYGNYITQARAANIPTKDIALLRLLICGFSTPQISAILDVTTNVIATRKNRLKQKLKKAGLPSIPEIA